MNKEELKRAVELAKERHVDFSQTNLHLFTGFGLKAFKPLHCTISDVADLIRWQAFKFDGELDTEAINEIAEAGRHKFIIVD